MAVAGLSVFIALSRARGAPLRSRPDAHAGRASRGALRARGVRRRDARGGGGYTGLGPRARGRGGPGSLIARSNAGRSPDFAWVPAEGWLAARRGPRRRRRDLPASRRSRLIAATRRSIEAMSRRPTTSAMPHSCAHSQSLLAALARRRAARCPPPRKRPRREGLQVPGGGIEPSPAGAVPWELLQQAKTVQGPDKKFGPVFTREIAGLDRRT